MFKMVMVSFRTSQDLKDSLDQIGREVQRSRSSLIETILKEYMIAKRRRNGKAGIGAPQETAPLLGEGPAVLEDGNHIVLGGVRIAIPKDLPLKIVFDEKTAAFRVEFPNEGESQEAISNLRLTG